MVNLIPSSESVMQILRETGAYRQGHFVFPNGNHASHYFQMPLAFRYYDNSRVLSVGLSRKFRMDKMISSRLPKISVISPSPGGIPVAFAVREALGAEQIYWAELEDGKRQFRQYLKEANVYPCIIVDDLIRTGTAMTETINLVKDLGSEVLGCGAIVKFEEAPDEIEGVKVQSLAQFDCEFYETLEEWQHKENNTAPGEFVRF
jgi:orotate phosphoribosyltransferase